MTPAPSIEGEGRVTRARGSGQVALSRPRTRATRTTRARKARIELSDDEEEEDVVKPMAKRAKVEQPPPPVVVTMEEAKVEEGDEGRRTRLSTPDVPAIVVVSATPGPSQQAKEEPASPADDAPPTPTDSLPSESELKPPVAEAPTLAESLPSEPKAEVQRAKIELEENEEPSDVRVLHPTTGFEHILLWTPDAPMPGFQTDELDDKEVEDEKEQGGEVEKSALGQLRRSWWRQGGAGEGGDEFVRGLGEWIGLSEIVSLFIST